jgi:hypothetical protein
MTEIKSKARQKFRPLEEPSQKPNYTPEQRKDWIDKTFEGFVQPSSANKAYYRVVLETLWPENHGIPGPYVSQDSIREGIDAFRIENQFGKNPEKPYVDVFRRVRELQGEEGLIGVARQGKHFQLVDLEIRPKRIPRTKLNDADWSIVKLKYGNSCAACKRKEPEVRFQQDHKIPRTRGYGDGIDNWQPLCDECNNFKSVACRGCELDCNKCCWAFPEKYSPVRLPPEILEIINSHCEMNNLNLNNFIEEIALNAISET